MNSPGPITGVGLLCYGKVVPEPDAHKHKIKTLIDENLHMKEGSCVEFLTDSLKQYITIS